MPREKEAGLGGMKAVADTVGGARGRPESSKEARETGDVKTGRVGTAGTSGSGVRVGVWGSVSGVGKTEIPTVALSNTVQ